MQGGRGGGQRREKTPLGLNKVKSMKRTTAREGRANPTRKEGGRREIKTLKGKSCGKIQGRV